MSAAFPSSVRTILRDALGGSSTETGEPGLSKRELFAGLAMLGILSNPRLSETAISAIARAASEGADALLAELAKK